MQTQKMGLANIKGKLSRAEMKNIMAGSGGGTCGPNCNLTCSVKCNDVTTAGSCRANSNGCYCSAVC